MPKNYYYYRNFILKSIGRITILVVVLLSSLCCSCGAIKSSAILQEATVQKVQKNELSFKYDDSFSLILLTVKIKERTFRFVFDTGANATIVSKELANFAGLKNRSSIKVRDAHQELKKLFVGTIDSLFINQLCYSNVGVLINDFKENPQLSCLGIDGILGINVLKLNNWKINYQDSLMTVYGIDQLISIPIEAKSIPFKLNRQNLPYVDLYVNGAKEDFMLDTGKNSELISTSPKNILQPISIAIGNSSFGLFGKGSADTTKYIKVDIADSAAVNWPNIIVSQSKSLGALIGSGFFKKNYSWIAFSFQRNLLSLGDPKENTCSISYGFSPILVDANVVVGEKELDFSSEIDQIALGDTIIEVNGVARNNADPCQLLSEIWYAKIELRPLDIKILRNEMVFSYRLYGRKRE